MSSTVVKKIKHDPEYNSASDVISSPGSEYCVADKRIQSPLAIQQHTQRIRRLADLVDEDKGVKISGIVVSQGDLMTAENVYSESGWSSPRTS
jgi:hypothetical protein